jgi:hypothetical protein
MPREKQPKLEPDILDQLFGDPSGLPDDELDRLFTTLVPGSDPAASIRNAAEAAAVKYRLQNKLPPDHVQAALDRTRETKTIDNLPPSKPAEIVAAIKSPFTGAVYDHAFAYRNRDGELDEHDQAIIDRLADELERDWEEAERDI